MKEKISSDKNLAFAFRAFAHPARLNILRVIAQKCGGGDKNKNNTCCCTDVTKYIDLAQSTISQHIKVLLEAGLIERKSEGTKNCYSICYQRLDKVQADFDNYLKQQIIEVVSNE
ncbi:MAG: metalloregulator ArsR/SmtB family transcription factor [Devosiaceae bacterium]|nr:metalloregulator ArsR/SmtB family transcription factor [Devosiaceae bacterium]